MRIYNNAYELISEVFRDLWEMGTEVKPKSYQNKIIEGKDEFITKEIIMYNYALTSLPDSENLFLFEKETARRWCLAEFSERIDPGTKNPGYAWKIREEVWEEFLVNGMFNYTYSERLNHITSGTLSFIPNLSRIINRLKEDPDTRQAWLPIFFPMDVAHIGGSARVPCSLGYHFIIRNGQLDMVYIQRSADAVLHWGNDIYLAWLMKEYVANRVGVKAGYLYHNIFSLHSYKRDWDKLKAGISHLAHNKS